jgi:hypothetical protein
MKLVAVTPAGSSLLRGAVGWWLLGPVGGFIGAITAAAQKNVYQCSVCGRKKES